VSRYKWLIAVTAGMAMLAGIYLSTLLRDRGNDPNTGVSLYSLELPDLTGHTMNFSRWQGKVVLVNFWATWCPPCIEEIPLFMRSHDNYAKRGFEVIGIAIDDADKVRRFSQDLAINYPLLNGNEKGFPLMQQLNNRLGALPYSVLFDRQGRAVHFKSGAFTAHELDSLLQSHL
jgi:thiol-disulfide isomerase/thioredoxin